MFSQFGSALIWTKNSEWHWDLFDDIATDIEVQDTQILISFKILDKLNLTKD